MNVDEYLKATEKYSESGRYRFQKVRPHIKCVDGFTLSVQGSHSHYCSPRYDGACFSEVEIGFLSERVEEFMPYAEDSEHPTETVYGWVPLDIVEKVVAGHGGIKL